MASFIEHINHIISKGIAVTNRYRVDIFLPDIVQRKLRENNLTSSSKDIEMLSVMIDEVPLPDRTIPTTEIRYNGDFYKIPYAMLYENIEFVFGTTANMYEKNVIDIWMGCIFNPTTHEIEYMDQYSATIDIHMLNKNDEIVYTVSLKDSFPIICSSVQMSNASQNEHAKFNTTISYRKWVGAYDDESDVEIPQILYRAENIEPVFLPNSAVTEAQSQLDKYDVTDFTGESIGVFMNIEKIVSGASNTPINKLEGLLAGVRNDIESNDKITEQDKQNLRNLLDDINTPLRG